MARSDEEGRWGRSEKAALRRIHASRERVRRCEEARDQGVRLLEECTSRMQSMVERGEIGARKLGDGQEYPQARIVYWGEIESGAMSMMALEVDYGEGFKARAGAWCRGRALWECASMSPIERFEAFVRSFSLGSVGHAEKIWGLLRSALRALSSELELELEFADPEDGVDILLVGEELELPASWSAAWSSPRLPPQRAPEPEPREPTPAEWRELEAEARRLIDMVRSGMAEPPEPPAAGEGPPDPAGGA